MAHRRQMEADGQWVREAAMAYAGKRRARAAAAPVAAE